MNQVILENFRCFRRRQAAPLRQLTVLVGENSSGKSTFLAAIRLAWNALRAPMAVDFNEPPFFLGGYDQIASRGRHSSASSFSLGLGWRRGEADEGSAPDIRIVGTFRAFHNRPRLSDWRLTCRLEGGEYEAWLSTTGPHGNLQIRTPSGRIRGHWHAPQPLFMLPTVSSWFDKMAPSRARGVDKLGSVTGEQLKHLERAAEELLQRTEGEPFAFSPIRTSPQRIYDPSAVVTDSHGSHVVGTLSSLFARDRRRWRDLRNLLSVFGKLSGLFDAVDLKPLGDKGDDPFRIVVRVGRRWHNLTDVGYGVSQALPILVALTEAPLAVPLLLQQPEAHLHPLGQAGLASALMSCLRSTKRQIIVETHSDYFIDRLRIGVREGTVAETGVGLLFFDRDEGATQIHAIGVDRMGNVVGAPPSYRQFFLDEERRLLGIDVRPARKRRRRVHHSRRK